MPHHAPAAARLWQPPAWLFRASVLWATLLAVPMWLFAHFDTILEAIDRPGRTETLYTLGILLAVYLVTTLLAGLVYFWLLFRGERAVGNPRLLLWAYPLAAVILPILALCGVVALCLAIVALDPYSGWSTGLVLFFALLVLNMLPSWWLTVAPFGVFAGLALYVSLRPKSPEPDGAQSELDPAAPEGCAGTHRERGAGQRLLFVASTLWGALLGVAAFIFLRYPVYPFLGQRANFWNRGVAIAVLVTGLLAAVYFHLFFRLRDRSLRPWAYPLACSRLAAALLAAAPVVWYASGYRFAAGEGTAFYPGTIQPLMVQGERVLLGLFVFGLLTGALFRLGLRSFPRLRVWLYGRGER